MYFMSLTMGSLCIFLAVRSSNTHLSKCFFQSDPCFWVMAARMRAPPLHTDIDSVFFIAVVNSTNCSLALLFSFRSVSVVRETGGPVYIGFKWGWGGARLATNCAL